MPPGAWLPPLPTLGLPSKGQGSAMRQAAEPGGPGPKSLGLAKVSGSSLGR